MASESEFVTALLTFNVGVEAGQLAVIAAAFMLVGWHCTNRTCDRRDGEEVQCRDHLLGAPHQCSSDCSKCVTGGGRSR